MPAALRDCLIGLHLGQWHTRRGVYGPGACPKSASDERVVMGSTHADFFCSHLGRWESTGRHPLVALLCLGPQRSGFELALALQLGVVQTAGVAQSAGAVGATSPFGRVNSVAAVAAAGRSSTLHDKSVM